MENIVFDETMDVQKVIQIYNDLINISNGKFYNINVYDKPSGRYLGDCELINESATDHSIVLYNAVITKSFELTIYRYGLYPNGKYSRLLYTKQL